jgi:hypothetical protein
MAQRFENKNGRVLYFSIEPVKLGYPEGTLKVELKIYPEQGASYSSFIYTDRSETFIENMLPDIAEAFLSDERGSYGSREISDVIKKHIPAIFPQD